MRSGFLCIGHTNLLGRDLQLLSQNSNSDLTEGEIKMGKSQILLSHTAVHVLRVIN